MHNPQPALDDWTDETRDRCATLADARRRMEENKSYVDAVNFCIAVHNLKVQVAECRRHFYVIKGGKDA